MDKRAEPLAAWDSQRREDVPWDRADVPWDRPSDYDYQTDSAADQPGWDGPSNPDWFDSEAFEERTPVPAVITEPDGRSVASDPDDAYAPVLRDVHEPISRAWREMSGRHEGTGGTSQWSEPGPEATPGSHSAGVPQAEVQPPGSPPPTKPTSPVGQVLGPTPSADLFVQQSARPPVSTPASPFSTAEAPPRIEPPANAHVVEQTHGPDQAPQTQHPSQPTLWGQPPAAAGAFAPDPTAVPPWAQPDEQAPVASAPVAPAPVGEPVPPWAQSAYAPDALAQLPAVQAPVQPPLAVASGDRTEGKEPSAILTGILTIGMAILVIVLVLAFIQLMTSLVR